MKTLGIIPARGGSKRIPLKNVREFCGKPLIAWTIESALKGGLDRVIVSTDDEKIAEIARSFGAEAPFLRPADLAGDRLGIEPVLKHAYEALKKEGWQADALALLMPTNPFRDPEDIRKCMKLFSESGADSVVSVVRATANNNPYWILKKDAEGGVSLFHGEPLKNIITRSQDLPACYSRNDVIYVLKPENLYEDVPNLYGSEVELYEMDDFLNADINTEADWFMALQKMKYLKEHPGVPENPALP